MIDVRAIEPSAGRTIEPGVTHEIRERLPARERQPGHQARGIGRRPNFDDNIPRKIRFERIEERCHEPVQPAGGVNATRKVIGVKLPPRNHDHPRIETPFGGGHA